MERDYEFFTPQNSYVVRIEPEITASNAPVAPKTNWKPVIFIVGLVIGAAAAIVIIENLKRNQEKK
jgi:hypothetical protein